MAFDSSINMRNDLIFKYIFGYEKNERILIALLNAILGLEGADRIVKLTFLNTFNLQEYIKDKLSTLDVKAEDSTGRRINIEMQVESEQAYINRVIYYHDKLYTGQLKKSEPFEELNKAISISILNFILFKEEKELHNIYRYLNIKSKKELSDIKELHFIELPKFKKDKSKKKQSRFEKWLHVLKFGEIYADDIDNLPDELKEEEEIVMALQEMVRASNDEMVRQILEMRSKARHEEASRLYQAKQRGKEEGRKEGIEEGRKEGRKEGIEKRNIEIAKNLLKLNFPVEAISQATGLTDVEIEGLKKSC
ncbi:MAG TPA: Rpn family recombination-promoting nuclease/putative transposase [Candidatus Eremiobacteraeota bacterium]|nr:MAG: flagellar assembly protein H [bacterium ADurb.Bin363]HPZ07803.1 Rpn family recombination-promoting nuclease/putative transposase [Candidatus Eremiobacteraeota bacterium]